MSAAVVQPELVRTPLPAAGERGLYGHHDLARLLAPRSIAVLGASTREGSFGLRTVENLGEFDGAVYPINGKYDRVGERRCFPSLDDVPELPDCVVIALNRDSVEDGLRACVAAGVGGVIVYASGYAETRAPQLVELQDRLARMVQGTKTRLLGPNCLGVTNYARNARIMFGRMPVYKLSANGGLGIVAQSGSVSMSLGQAVERGIAISHAIPVGNAADVDIADLTNYLIDEPSCRAIVCTFEGVSSTTRLIAAARRAAEVNKPLIVYKMASGSEGAAAALSHTGSLAGSHAAYRAALKSAGAIMVDDLDDVIETAAFFAKSGRPTGRSVGVVLSSGGVGVMAADKAQEQGVPLLQPTGETLKILLANVPEFGAVRNPCDVTAQALNDETPLENCADAFLADPVYSTLLVMQPYADAIASARIPLWRKIAERRGKVVCNYWSTEALEGFGAHEVEQEPRIATFRSLRRCFAAIAAWHEREDILREQPWRTRTAPGHARQVAAGLIAADKRHALTERTGKQVLAAYGIPVVQDVVVQTIDEACAAFGKVGQPVAIKIESQDILHKTDAGVVRLNIRSESDLRKAFAEVMANARAFRPEPRIDGVLVQPMVPAGIELMMGARVDAQFGPMVIVGLGGILVEVLADTALAIAPVSRDQAMRMLRSLKGARVLQGFRGLPPVDLGALADIIVRFSELANDQADAIAEIDVNPLICRGSDAIAVDALLIRAG